MSGDRFRLIRPANLAAGVVVSLIALVLFGASLDGQYPVGARPVAALAGLATVVAATRCFQPSVTLSGNVLKVRRWLKTVTLDVTEVGQILVLDTWDGPIDVRKMAIVTIGGQTVKTNFQSRQPSRQSRVTATDRAVTALRTKIGAR